MIVVQCSGGGAAWLLRKVQKVDTSKKRDSLFISLLRGAVECILVD